MSYNSNGYLPKNLNAPSFNVSLSIWGHIISHKGEATDYKKFIYHYGIIAKPLTNLLKKDAFQWTSSAQQAFPTLRKAMTEALMLALPNFAVPFTIETETSNWEMDALWQQEGHPLAFISKAFDPRSQKTINL